MRKRWLLLFLAIALTGCNAAGTTVTTAPSAETQAQASMKNRLDQLLESCLAAASSGRTPSTAESLARAVYTQWKASQRGQSQFHVQAQLLANGQMQIQLQAQLAEGANSVQAQRQALLPAIR